ncbi:LL-diaminopimelate aminotransferase [Fervidibacter sacchari]|uniref:Aminotransferase n=1 Tax=Candidatus Fervidibacter sacchari TaxID=1448929 RepID=A0ABT2ENJ2_9BACT|nr:LL-diaminopimelate aminotransferase [Candidatus Fervidibacter sacchari]MCS3919254.1 LL-diaminopimelate aminotransferase [Candidatus Fervidibacter sacchari]WKU14994.1 LL-diaminopimelate aminotransferase [Candidatus Fervidibacter sacchari]
MPKPSQRMEKLGPYLFSAIGAKVRELKAKGIQVISLGIGDPDVPTPDPIVLELIRSATDVSDPDRFRYGSDWPLDVFPKAVAEYYRKRFGVEIDPQREVVPLIGSKEGIAHIALCYLDPGDVALVPEPGYPVYKIGALLALAESYPMPLLSERNWTPNFSAIPSDVLKRAKLLWLNYPNNPTASCVTLEFFEEAVAFAKEHGLLICHDAAYVDITYDGYVAPSILQVPGAKEVAIEFGSLSKPFAMTGWRIGWAVGNPEAVRLLATVKDNIDSGIFRPIQRAGAKALQLWCQDPSIIRPVVDTYQRRRDFVLRALREAGIQASTPKGSLYIWAPIPNGFTNSQEFATFLLERAHVAVTPGGGYGPAGEGYFRISLTYPDTVIAEAMERIVDALKRG